MTEALAFVAVIVLALALAFVIVAVPAGIASFVRMFIRE